MTETDASLLDTADSAIHQILYSMGGLAEASADSRAGRPDQLDVSASFYSESCSCDLQAQEVGTRRRILEEAREVVHVQ